MAGMFSQSFLFWTISHLFHIPDTILGYFGVLCLEARFWCLSALFYSQSSHAISKRISEMLQKHIGNFDISYIPPVSFLYHSYILQHCIKKRERLISLKETRKALEETKKHDNVKNNTCKVFQVASKVDC